ncbi:hypothetical protein [Allosphingosinicella deserti]|uniref:Secreted protein n=1 Tax=Allosphingosinicella deserti TaxID=2116704 RepID=A0A2P7QR40_9SPHN|nr:hypothetical protein [Sphingomonas deserti]PSJ40436.1 hypothetical protein C7I55_08850 [Sphingomonas deserti]
MRYFAVVGAAFLFALSALPADAAEPAAQDPDQVACVPLRDKHNRPTGTEVCKTAKQWQRLLDRHAALLRAPAQPIRPFN